jgi:hypothetical protein
MGKSTSYPKGNGTNRKSNAGTRYKKPTTDDVQYHSGEEGYGGVFFHFTKDGLSGIFLTIQSNSFSTTFSIFFGFAGLN